MKYKEYKATKNPNLLNMSFAILVGSVIAIFLGWIYSVIAYIPIVYFNFLLTIGFGFALAFSVQIISKFLKITDRKSRLMIIIITAIIAYYSHWIAFVVQIYTKQFPNFKDYLSYWIYPNGILEAVAEINKFGTWGIGTSGYLANGSTLSLIWLIEGAIIILVAIATVHRFPENPYSDKLNKWYPKIVLDEEFENMYSSKRFLKNLNEQNINYIIDLKNGLGSKYSKISIFYLESEDKQYLSVDSVYINKSENSRLEITEIVKPIEISTIEAKKLFQKFKTKKEFYLDY